MAEALSLAFSYIFTYQVHYNSMHQYQFPIESERLSFRYFEEADMAEWAVFFTENPMMHYVGATNPEAPELEAKKFIERQTNRYKTDGFGTLAAIEKASGEIVGSAGIIYRQHPEFDKMHEIGYSVIPSRWGKGYATEMARCFFDYFVAQKLANKVISIIDEHNTASQKVAANNGMQRGPRFNFNGFQCYQYYRNIE